MLYQCIISPYHSKTLCNTPTDLDTTESVCWLSYGNVKNHADTSGKYESVDKEHTQRLGNKMQGRVTSTYIHMSSHLYRGKNAILYTMCIFLYFFIILFFLKNTIFYTHTEHICVCIWGGFVCFKELNQLKIKHFQNLNVRLQTIEY